MKKFYATKYILTCVLLMLILGTKPALAQQVPLLDQYYINPTVYNPAAAGANGIFNAYLLRNQKFANFDGGQVTHVFTADAALKEKYGVGFNLTSDNVGIFNNTQALLSYAYRLKVTTGHYLRLGLSAGISDFRVNMNEIRAKPDDPYLVNTDYKNTEFMANMGLYYTYKDLVIGLTIPQLLNNSVSESDNESETSYKLIRHAMLAGGYQFKIPQVKDLTITPYIMMRYAKSSPVQYDMNLIANLADKGWFALSYKDEYSFGLNLGVRVLKNFVVGYAYDIGIQKSGRYSSNNHEFLIGYRLKRKDKKEPEKIPDNDGENALKALLAEQYNKIDLLRHQLEEMKEKEKQLDGDRDGIPNELDLCPDTPPFHVVNEQGCPIDSDNDGIVDSEDFCPEIPGTIENNGCPEQKEERIEMEEKMENIYFAFGKHQLSKYSHCKLQLVVELMLKNKSYILKMHGYTDDIGSNKSNMELSYKRLLTVKDYLVLNGVPDNRIVIIPHGETNPAAANTDNKSRADNRRVTFEIYNY